MIKTGSDKHDYNIYLDNSPKMFKRACMVLEKAHPELEKEELLIDVDGSTVQIYGREPNKVVVYDDYDVGAVYIKSGIDLSECVEEIRGLKNCD